MHSDPGQQRSLTTQDSYRRLAGVSVGRIAFTMMALPVIRPVNHLVHDDDVIIRGHADAALITAVGQVVAYEADTIDPATRSGWSVLVTGKATLVSDPRELEWFRNALRPWYPREAQHVMRIRPGIVTGYELLYDAATAL